MEGGPAEPMFVLATAHGRADAVCRVLAYGLLAFPRRGAADADHALCVQNFRAPPMGVLVPLYPAYAVSSSTVASSPSPVHTLRSTETRPAAGEPRGYAPEPEHAALLVSGFGRTKPRNQNSGPQITMRRALRHFGVRRILELFRAPGETANGNACPAGQMDAPDAACAKHRGRDRRQSADAVLGAQGRQYQGVRPPLQSASWPMF